MKNKFKNIIIIILIFLFSMAIVEKTFQNDTFFTIAVGEKILKQGFFEEETFTFHEGLKYQNVRWLFDVLITIIYQTFGYVGIYYFVILITSIIGIVLYYSMFNQGIRKELAFIGTLLILYFNKVIFCGRAQILSFLLIIIEYYNVKKLMETNKNKYIFPIVLVGLLLPNIHASIFPLYFVVFVPYIAERILAQFKIIRENNDKIIVEKKNIKKLLIALIGGIIVSFVTPINFAQYLNMFKTVDQISSDAIKEMLPLTIFENIPFFCLLICFIAIVAFTKVKIKITDLFFIIGYALLGLSNVRSVFFFYFICSQIIIGLINELFNLYNLKFEIKDKFYKIIIYTLIIFAFIVICLCNFMNRVIDKYVSTTDYSIDAANFILGNYDLDELRLFNGFSNGSYLEFVGIPVFLDSRAEIYLKTFNNCTILEDYVELLAFEVDYQVIFDKYDINHILIKNSEVLNKLLYTDEKWNIVYQDDIYTLYEKAD